MFDALRCSKKYILFTSEEGAEMHYQCGASALSNHCGYLIGWMKHLQREIHEPIKKMLIFKKVELDFLKNFLK